LEKAKQLTEATLRGLRERLEEEEVARRNFEELARRHERKSNTLQSELEQLETQLDANERSRKQLEMRVTDLQAELDDGQSRVALQESNDRLNAELNRIREQLAREEETRAELEAARSTMQFNNVGAQDTSEHAAQLEKLEESKRALLVAQKLAQQELEDQRREAETLERQRTELLQEMSKLKSSLEAEIVAKGEEAATRQKLEAELAELRLHLDVEMVKSAEMADSVKVYRDKIESIMTRMEEAELARSKAEKNEAYVQQQLKDTEESMRKALADRQVAEERTRVLEEKVMQLQDRIDDDAITLADLNVIRERLQQEVEEGLIKFQKELDEKDSNTETMRTMYQNELKTITEELERERSTLVNLREVQHDLEAEIDDLHNRLEAAELNATSIQKDRVKADTRLSELERIHDETVIQRDELQGQIGTLRSQLTDIRLQLEESEAKRELAEKAKKHLQQRLDEIDNNFNTIHMGREAVEKSLTERDHEAAHLREMLEQQQAAVAEATARLKKSEAAAATSNTEMLKERELNKELLRAKVSFANIVSICNTSANKFIV
jgi:myosin protein heavy chain